QANENGKGGYTVGEKIMSLVYGLVLDLERPADTEVLKRDKVFQAVIGYEYYPDQSIFSRFLRSFSVSGATDIGVKNVEMLFRVRHNFSDWSKLTFDMDSHVKTVYGNQQRAQIDLLLDILIGAGVVLCIHADVVVVLNCGNSP